MRDLSKALIAFGVIALFAVGLFFAGHVIATQKVNQICALGIPGTFVSISQIPGGSKEFVQVQSNGVIEDQNLNKDPTYWNGGFLSDIYNDPIYVEIFYSTVPIGNLAHSEIVVNGIVVMDNATVINQQPWRVTALGLDQMPLKFLNYWDACYDLGNVTQYPSNSTKGVYG